MIRFGSLLGRRRASWRSPPGRCLDRFAFRGSSTVVRASSRRGPAVVGRSFIVAPQQLIVPQAVIQSQSFIVPQVQSFVAPVRVQSFSTGCGALDPLAIRTFPSLGSSRLLGRGDRAAGVLSTRSTLSRDAEQCRMKHF